jgi:hypothetical protein
LSPAITKVPFSQWLGLAASAVAAVAEPATLLVVAAPGRIEDG